MPAEIDTMMYVGEMPWHGLGVELNKPATAEEAIIAAGLDWEVKLSSVLFESWNNEENEYNTPGEYENQNVIYRTDNQKPLGIIGNRYQPIQNRDAFKFFDPIVGEGAAIYHTAGSLRDGKTIWLLAKLPNDIEVGQDDIVEQYVLLTNNHEGKQALRIRYTPIRVVCMNTLQAALMTPGKIARVWHSGDVDKNFRSAAEFLGMIKIVAKESAVIWRKMYKQITEIVAIEYFEKVFINIKKEPPSLKLTNTRDRLLYLFYNGMGNEGKAESTIWAAYNAVTEYLDHFRMSQALGDRRLWSTWFGTGVDIRQRATAEAIKLI